MRKLAVVATVVAAGSAIVGFFIPESAGPVSAGTEVRFFTHDTQQAQLDLGDKGDSLGDRYVFSGDVLDHEGGTKIGRLTGFCDTVSRRAANDGEDICFANVVLARGQLMSSTTVDHAGFLGGTPQRISITGGTGIYRDAQGEGTVTVLNATDTNTVIHLD
jgi:hypothetical protein